MQFDAAGLRKAVFSVDSLLWWGPVLLFALAVTWLRSVPSLGIPMERQGLAAIGVGAGLALVVLLGAGKDHERRWLAAAQVLALGLGWMLLWLLRQAEYAPGGFWGDNWFSNALIMHYKVDAGNHDFTYQGLHGFYPALFHWVCARLAVIFAIPAHQMLPLAAIWCAYLLPLLSFAAWRRLVDGKTAFLISSVVIFLSLTLLTNKPYEAISLILILPWYLAYQHRMEAERGFLSRKVVLGGVLGGLLAMTYYYWFFLFVLVFLGEFGLQLREKGLKGTWNAFKPRCYVLVWLLVASLPFWAPLLYDMLSHPFHSSQNRWFRPWMTTSSLFLHRPWFVYAGLLYLLFASGRGGLPRFLLGLLVALLVWNLIGMAGMGLGFPLLHARMNLFFDWAALLGLALGAVELGEWALARFNTPLRWTLAGLSILLLFQSTSTLVEFISDETYPMALETKPPEIVLDPGMQAFAPGKVFLSNRHEINAHLPVYFFVGHNEYYAHPAAEFEKRVMFLKLLSQSQNSDFVAWMLAYNRWDAVDGVYWEDKPMYFGLDNFPSEKHTLSFKVQFAPEIFQGKYFHPQSNGKWHKLQKPPFELQEGFTEVEKVMVRMYGNQD